MYQGSSSNRWLKVLKELTLQDLGSLTAQFSFTKAVYLCHGEEAYAVQAVFLN